MLRAGKSGPSQSQLGSVAGLKVVVAADGHLEFVPPPRRRASDRQHRLAAVAPVAVTSREEALIAANRAKLAELRSLPANTIPDFPDALIASLTRSLPALSHALTLIALRDAGLLADDAVLAGATSLAFIANRLADRGYVPTLSEQGQAAQTLFYGDAFGILHWLLLDWISRSIIAAAVDDTELEDDLDAYYPRWSRTDFEWDIRRLTQAPVLNPYPAADVQPDERADAALSSPPPAIPRRRQPVLPAQVRRLATETGSPYPSVPLDRRVLRNHARERRAQR